MGRRVSEFLVVGLGDSITAGNPGWDPDPERRPLEDPGDDETSQYLYWAARANPGMRFRNHGVGGERTDEIRARLESAAPGADVIVVQGGINDVVQGRSIALAAADLEAMVRRAKELAPVVLLPNVLPWNNGWPDAEPQVRELNELIAGLAEAEDVPLLPFHETLEDPELPGRMKAELTPDGNHPSVEGHRRLGELAFRLPRGWAESRRR
jgi:lysophospholipase L1-like esterase